MGLREHAISLTHAISGSKELDCFCPSTGAPSDKFSFDRDSAECAVADLLRVAEALDMAVPFQIVMLSVCCIGAG